MRKKLKKIINKSKAEPIAFVIHHLFRHYLFRMFVFSFFPKYSIIYLYEKKMNKNIDINKPKTYNEKIQWFKIYNHNPIYTQLTDKYLVREFVKEKIGEEYLIPLLGVWDTFDQIEFDKLPNEFVLKCNHDSGSIEICKNKKEIDYYSLKKRLTKKLNRNYYYNSGEWQYKNIKRKIIAEKYMVDERDKELTDYKFLCFNGEPYYCQVDSNRFSNHERSIYDMNWERMPFIKSNLPQISSDIPKPKKFDEMKQIVRKLSAGFSQVRVDLYLANDHIYFGEMTFTSGSGVSKFYPDEYDLIIGEMWHLKI